MLINMQDLKVMFRMTDATDDDVLIEILKRVDAEVKQYCTRDFELATYTETRSGDGTRIYRCAQYPIVSVTSLYDDVNRLYTSDTLIPADSYRVENDSGIIVLDGIVFYKGLGNIKVVYSAGFAAGSIPEDLRQACLMMARKYYLENQSTYNSINGEVEKKMDALKKDAYEIFDRYKKVDHFYTLDPYYTSSLYRRIY
jgi:hypothetical protein